MQRCAPKTGSFVGGGAPAPSNNTHAPALDALKRAGADAFRPLLDNFNHVRSLKNLADANDYNIGMPYGVAVAILGCYQLLKMAPWTLLDVVLGYLFYKLSVVSSQVHRQGFANDFITMIKVVISIVMVIKLLHSGSDALGFLRMPVLQLYLGTFYCYMKDWKEDARYDLTKFFKMLQVKIGGQAS
ncbi:unnamed protein product [Urochloa decumbens]|uniref:Uncharacterized protein n=1 Tax=Urochloa decumbens TaxID=240449 RepID=A0ABC9G5E0_9POAL